MSRARAATLLLAALLAVPRLAAQTIAVSPGGERSASVGTQLDVPLVVDMSARPDRLGAFAMRLTWNPAVLQYQGGGNGSFGAVAVASDSSSAGIIRVAGANASGATGLVTVGVLRLSVLVADTTTLNLTVSQLFAAQSFANLLPFASVSSGQFCPARGHYGDIDGDGSANSRDALLALSNAVGLSVAPYDITLGDVDASGATNARDALIVLSAAVGLDVSGYRVLAVAGGACAGGLPATLALSPGTPGDVMVNQTLHLEARATDQSGNLQVVRNAVWSSSDPLKVSLLPDGTALARDTGVVTVTAIKDGRDSASVSLHVVAHRTTHVVDALAVGAANAIGTATLPFRTIADAMAVAANGDTVRIRPGRYAESLNLGVNALVIGDTLPDGTRPEIAVNMPGGYGILISGGGRSEVRNIAVRDAQIAVFVVSDAGHVELDGIRAQNVGSGLDIASPLQALTVRRSTFLGSRANGGSGDAVFSFTIDTVLIEDSEFGDFDGAGISILDFDTATVRRTSVHDVESGGMMIGGTNAKPATGRNVLLEDNIVARADPALTLNGVGHAVVRRNQWLNGQGDGSYLLSLRHARHIRISGDSLEDSRAPVRWLDGLDVDTLFLDSLRAWVTSDGTIDDARYTRITNSRFRGARHHTFSLYHLAPEPGVTDSVVVRNTLIEGDPACDRCAHGIFTFGAPVLLDSVTVRNVLDGLVATGQDSNVTVLRSLFQHNYRAISVSGIVRSPLARIMGNTFDGFQDEAIVLQTGWAVIDSNVIRDGSRSVSISAYDQSVTGGLTFTRNRITRARGLSASLADTIPTHVADNVLIDVEEGHEVFGQLVGPDTVRVLVERDSITCLPASNGTGVRVSQADAQVLDNYVSGCYRAMQVENQYVGAGYARPASIRRNTVRLAPGSIDGGIRVEGNLRSTIRHNRITGDSAGSVQIGAIDVGWVYYNCTTPGECEQVVSIDSNVVANVPDIGIRVGFVDSLFVRDNRVDTVGVSNQINSGNLVLAGDVRYRALLHGNTLRFGEVGFYSTQRNDTVHVELDSNRIVNNTLGLRQETGAVSLTRNRVTGSLLGMQLDCCYSSVFLDQNNFGGNQYGLYDQSGGFVSVSGANNWWGAADGFACDTVCGSGDSVSTSITGNLLPFATSEFTFTPPPAPPVMRVPRAARAVVARMAPRPAAALAAAPRPAAARPDPARQLAAQRAAAQASRAAMLRPLTRPTRRVGTPVMPTGLGAEAEAAWRAAMQRRAERERTP